MASKAIFLGDGAPPLSPLFRTPTEAENPLVAWRAVRQTKTVLEAWTQATPLSVTAPETLRFPDLLLGALAPSKSGVLISRDIQSSNQTLGANPVSSYLVSLRSGTVVGQKRLDLFSAHGVGIGTEGNGYILLSNERPPFKSPDKQSLNIENVSLYVSKLQDFLPADPQVLFELPARNRDGSPVVKAAAIDSFGSGFAIYYGSDDIYYLQKFTRLKREGAPQVLVSPGNGANLDIFYQLQGKEGVVYWSQQEGSSSKIFVKPVRDALLSAETYAFPISDQRVNLLTPNGTYRKKSWDLDLDAQGNGVLVNIQRQTGTPTLQLQRIAAFRFAEAREYRYSDQRALVDVSVTVDSQGDGKLFFLDGSCSSPQLRCKEFTTGNSLRMGYLPVSDFALE